METDSAATPALAEILIEVLELLRSHETKLQELRGEVVGLRAGSQQVDVQALRQARALQMNATFHDSYAKLRAIDEKLAQVRAMLKPAQE